MPNCGDQSCNCLVKAGVGVSVTGAGTGASPYVIGLEGDLSQSLIVQDSESVNLLLFGAGTPTDPYTLSAVATVRLTQLADVSDPQGGPNVGDVPVWVGGATPHFEFQPPPANPPGAVNVGAGMQGDGSAGAPLRPRLLGLSAGGATTGLEVYVDSVGNLRAVPGEATSVDWSLVANKPEYFPANSGSFVGTLAANKGGTGQTDLANVTVGNSTRVNGVRVTVQSSAPASPATNDLWFF